VISQNHKDPVWIVQLQVAKSSGPSFMLGSNGQPAMNIVDHHPPSNISVHGPDEATAAAYVVQQNPGAKILSVKEVSIVPSDLALTNEDLASVNAMKKLLSA
jgi:hypothetical protein